MEEKAKLIIIRFSKMLIKILMQAENKSINKFRVNLVFGNLHWIFSLKFLIECD